MGAQGGHRREVEAGDAAAPPSPPFLERIGLDYLRRRSAELPPARADDAVHVLDEGEQAELRRVQVRMVSRAALVGGLSGLAAALAEVVAEPLKGPDPDAATFMQTLWFWLVVGGVTGLATLAEVGYLYWDSLRSVHDMARGAGVILFSGGKLHGSSPLARVLTRAALEIPNPPEERFGIDPHREVSKLQLLAATLLYKAKVSITALVLKVLLRRTLGRAAVRMWLVFVGVPVTAFWNALVAQLVVREARIRAIGPSAASVLCEAILPPPGTLSEEGQLAAWRAVAATVVRTHDLHPNVVAMLRELESRLGPPPPDSDVDDSSQFLAQLPSLSPAELRVALQLLAVAAVLDGRIAWAERRLLLEAREAAGRAPDLDGVRKLRRAFMRGAPVSAGDLAAACGEPA